MYITKQISIIILLNIIPGKSTDFESALVLAFDKIQIGPLINERNRITQLQS